MLEEAGNTDGILRNVERMMACAQSEIAFLPLVADACARRLGPRPCDAMCSQKQQDFSMELFDEESVDSTSDELKNSFE